MLDTTEAEETGVGNYFISNYPQYSFWKPELVNHVHEVLNTPLPDNPLPLGIYFHIPFCRKRCHFCYFRVYTDKKASEIRAYIDSGIKEIEKYGNMPYLKGRKPKFIYFGGGTPSYLSVSQLTDSASGIHARHNPFYIRTVRGDNKDPLTQFMKEEGIPFEADITKPMP